MYGSSEDGMATVWSPTVTRTEYGVVSPMPSKVNGMPG